MAKEGDRIGTKLGRWDAKLGRCVAKEGDGRLSTVERWVAT